MQLKPLFLIFIVVPVLFSSELRAERLALEDAAKQLLRDSATIPAPVDPTRTVDTADQSVEKAKNLKESMDRPPTALREPATAVQPQEAGTKTEKAAVKKKHSKKSVKSRTKKKGQRSTK